AHQLVGDRHDDVVGGEHRGDDEEQAVNNHRPHEVETGGQLVVDPQRDQATAALGAAADVGHRQADHRAADQGHQHHADETQRELRDGPAHGDGDEHGEPTGEENPDAGPDHEVGLVRDD